MKRSLIAIPAVVLVLLAILLVAPSFIDWSIYKGKAQAQIKNMTGYDVALNGKLSLGFIPSPRVYIGDVVVKAPEGSQTPYLASLERLEARVALLPLFSGEVVISAVELVKPQIALEILRNEQPNWMTPELKALSEGKDLSPEKFKEKVASAGSKVAQAISLDKLSIEDGWFSFTTAGKVNEIEDIDLVIKAETLQGPFEVSGAVSFAGQPVNFTLMAGEIETEVQSMSLTAEAEYNGVAVNYAGVVAFGAEPGLQGETKIVLNSLAQVAKNFGAKDLSFSNEGASLKGLLTATTEKLQFKNAGLDIGGHAFTADFTTQLSPLYVSGSFASAETFNLDKIMPPKGKAGRAGAASSGGSASGAPGGAQDLSAMLPETLSLPMSFGADVKFSLPSLIYNNQVFNGVNLALAKKDKSFQAKFSADQIPGKGKIASTTDLTFSEKSISKKTGAEIYSGSSLSFTVRASTPDLPFTLQALTGEPASLVFRDVTVDAKGYIKPGKVQLTETNIVLDGKGYSISGALEGQSLLVNVAALGGKVMLKGDLTADFNLQNVALQVAHPNLAKAIQDFSGAPTQNAMLAQKIDFYTKLDQQGDVYTLSDIKAALGASSVSGSMTYNGGAAKPSVSGALSFGDLFLQSAPASASRGKSRGSNGGSGGAKSSARWSKAQIDTAWLDLANIDLAIDAKSIKYESWDLTKPQLQFTLQDGILKIKDFSSGLYGGAVALSGTVKALSGGGLDVQGATQMSNIQMGPLVKSLANNQIIKGQGSISSETTLKTAGVSHSALINALGGQGTVTGTAIVLDGIDLNRFVRALSEEGKAGDSLLNMWKGTTGGGSTAFERLDGAFVIENGVVTLSKMDLDGARGTIATTGTLDLPAWALATSHTMSVKDRVDVPPFTMEISGSLDNPGQTFAQGAIQDYFQRKLSRKLEKVLNEQLSGNLGDALGAFLGTPKQQQPAPANDNGAATQQQQGQPVQQQQQPQQQQSVKPEEAFRGLLEGLIQ